jgi:hypothetical protein
MEPSVLKGNTFSRPPLHVSRHAVDSLSPIEKALAAVMVAAGRLIIEDPA